MPEIFLVGTVHTDPFGEERLRRAIGEIKPDAITVEAVDGKDYTDSEEKIARTLRAARQLPASEEILGNFEKYLRTYKYEVRVPRRCGVPVHLVDEDTGFRPSAAWIVSNARILPEDAPAKEMPESVRKYNGAVFRTMFFFIGAPGTLWQAAEYYGMALLEREELEEFDRWSYGQTFANLPNEVELEYRDLKMARRIRSIGVSRLLHVGGMAHMFGDYYNLYQRLCDKKPERYGLNEF